MNKALVGILLAVVALGAIAGAVVLNKPKNSGTINPGTAQVQQGSTDDMSVNTQPVRNNHTSDTQQTNTVSIIDTNNSYDYSPKKIQVKKGTTVKWTNESNTKHDVTPTKETAEFKSSKLLAKGEAYEVTFNTLGTFDYFCSPHPFMRASVEVVE